MYIWIACDLSDSLGKVREECLALNKKVGADEVAFSLPQHISLKISFRIDDGIFENVISDIRGYFAASEPFSIAGPVLEKVGNIVWLRFDEEPTLVKMHTDFDEMMLHKYGVPQHEFDKSFAYHSTLFIEQNREKLELIYDKISEVALPKTVDVSRFIIGVSETGKAGEYRVLELVSPKK